MISAKQIKMARAMLDWSQEDLAQVSRLSLNTVYNLERGHISPRKLTIVRTALENKGVEFLGTEGVNRRADEHKIFAGTGSCDKFYDDLLATVTEYSCEVFAIFETQEIMANVFGATDAAGLARLERLGKQTKVQCLLSDAGHTSMSLPSFEFRAVPKHLLAPMSLLIYDNNLALVIANGADYTFFVVSSASAAYGWRKRFETDWIVAASLSV